MSALRSLPRHLSCLLAAMAAEPGPVRVVVDHEVQVDLVARVCREAGAPLSPPSPTADRDVQTGATRGYVAGPGDIPNGDLPVIRLADIAPSSPNPVLEARIWSVLEDVWRAGIDLPSIGIWPSGSRLAAGSRLLPGKALGDRRDLGLGEDIAACLDAPDGPFPVGLRGTCADVLRSWQQLRGRTAVTAVVSSAPADKQILSSHLATGAAAMLGAEYVGKLAGNKPPSGDEDPRDRVSRLASQLRLDPARVDVSRVAGKHVLLVGASWTQGWTMTVSGQLLLSAGAASVRPFTLSSDIRRGRRR